MLTKDQELCAPFLLQPLFVGAEGLVDGVADGLCLSHFGAIHFWDSGEGLCGSDGVRPWDMRGRARLWWGVVDGIGGVDGDAVRGEGDGTAARAGSGGGVWA